MKQEAATQNIKNQLKSSTANEKKEEIKNKLMHGQFHQDLESPLVDEQKSLMWLCSSGLKEETESLIIVAQTKHSIHVTIRGISRSNQQTVNAKSGIRQNT
jgi:hypothetical protein